MRVLVVVLCVSFIIPDCCLAQVLTVGSGAPELMVSKWVKGTPVNRIQKGKVHVIGFTAVNCGYCRLNIPRLTELSKKYEGQALFINVYSIDQEVDKIKKYIQLQGEKMGYTVGLDDKAGTMYKAWMTKAGKEGIPNSFIVNSKGKISWIGHPGSVEFDDAIRQTIVNDIVNITELEKEASMLNAAVTPIQKAIDSNGDYSVALRVLDSLIITYPWAPDYGNIKLKLLDKYDKSKAIAYAREDIIRNPEKKRYSNDSILYNTSISIWNGQTVPFAGGTVAEYVRSLSYYYNTPFQRLATLNYLYLMAYLGMAVGPNDSLYGKVHFEPVLELRDPTSSGFTYGVEKGLDYLYHLQLPIENISEENIMKEMQKALQGAFGYKAQIEERPVPVLKLIAEPGTAERLKSGGGKEHISIADNAKGYSLINYPAKSLMPVLMYHLSGKHKEVFIDETGLSGNIDFEIQADMTDLEDIRVQLRKHGLDVLKDKKMMKVLVIRDPS